MTAPSLSSLIGRVRELDKVAAPGPWERADGVVFVIGSTVTSVPVCCNNPTKWGECCGNAVEGQEWEQTQEKVADSTPEDASFIAESRTLLVQLADAAERMQQERDEARKVARDWIIAVGPGDDKKRRWTADRCRIIIDSWPDSGPDTEK